MAPGPAIVMPGEVESERVGRPALQEITHHDEVAQRLAHLGTVVLDHGRVQPAADEGHAPRESLRLRDLTLVMRKDEVRAAGVNIERRPQIARAHDGALDVPARAPRSPRARPRGLSGRLRLPEHEVERIALARVVGTIAAP